MADQQTDKVDLTALSPVRLRELEDVARGLYQSGVCPPRLAVPLLELELAAMKVRLAFMAWAREREGNGNE